MSSAAASEPSGSSLLESSASAPPPAPGGGAAAEDDGGGAVSSLLESMHFPGMPTLAMPATPPAAPALSPFVTRQTAVEINGQHTDVVVQAFADRVFVTITQTGKIGTMVGGGGV
jgi:hypothetical protein